MDIQILAKVIVHTNFNFRCRWNVSKKTLSGVSWGSCIEILELRNHTYLDQLHAHFCHAIIMQFILYKPALHPHLYLKWAKELCEHMLYGPRLIVNSTSQNSAHQKGPRDFGASNWYTKERHTTALMNYQKSMWNEYHLESAAYNTAKYIRKVQLWMRRG